MYVRRFNVYYSSGIQVLATIQPEVKQLYHWIRSPTWITPAFAQQFAAPGGKNFECRWYSQLCAVTKHAYRHWRAEETFCWRSLSFVEISEDDRGTGLFPLSATVAYLSKSELNQRFKFIVQGTPEQKAVLDVSFSSLPLRVPVWTLDSLRMPICVNDCKGTNVL